MVVALLLRLVLVASVARPRAPPSIHSPGFSARMRYGPVARLHRWSEKRRVMARSEGSGIGRASINAGGKGQVEATRGDDLDDLALYNHLVPAIFGELFIHLPPLARVACTTSHG